MVDVCTCLLAVGTSQKFNESRKHTFLMVKKHGIWEVHNFFFFFFHSWMGLQEFLPPKNKQTSKNKKQNQNIQRFWDIVLSSGEE